MSKLLRLLGAVAIAGATIPFVGVSAAAADDASLTPSASAYFYAEGVAKPDESPAGVPNVTGDRADGVSPGNLAVGANAGKEDKVSFLLFDLFSIEPGSTVSKAVLTLPLVANDPPNDISFGEDPVKVKACLAGPEGFGGDDGTDLALAPARKCDVLASKPAKKSTDGNAYEVDITALAQKWVDGDNDGVALVPSEVTTPFQVVFAAAAKSKLAVSYTAAAAIGVPPVVQTPTLGGGTGSTGTTDLGGGFSGGSGSAPVSGGGFGSVTAPVVPDAPVPGAAAAPATPTVAAPAAVTGPVTLEHLRPTAAFWLGGLVLAAALVLLSLIMGDPTVPTATRRPSRLSRALADRQRGGSAGRPALGRTAAV